ncbi:hypothetical protein [Mesorhizobium sp.]|uniref:hypothetical protein n=1 Tax=Mesorhizobium sp. TaxID=1871066 RepID=UPI000FE57FB7|nr:hypothetical protein [Mesorhizobium sp.]RWF32743.1 MAG: hypothetical protein EOS44_15595 [Mesorhizobium sp.]
MAFAGQAEARVLPGLRREVRAGMTTPRTRPTVEVETATPSRLMSQASFSCPHRIVGAQFLHRLRRAPRASANPARPAREGFGPFAQR